MKYKLYLRFNDSESKWKYKYRVYNQMRYFVQLVCYFFQVYFMNYSSRRVYSQQITKTCLNEIFFKSWIPMFEIRRNIVEVRLIYFLNCIYSKFIFFESEEAT